MKKNLLIALMILTQNTFAEPEFHVLVSKCEYGSNSASVSTYQISGSAESQANEKGQSLKISKKTFSNGLSIKEKFSAVFVDENGAVLEGSIILKEGTDGIATSGIERCDSANKVGRYQMHIYVR